MGEVALAAIFCALIAGGKTESTHAYTVGYDLRRIRVDCETDTHVIEIGLDKRSSLDSVQQALFAAHLTGKRPKILLVDTDGRTGPYETRIRAVAAISGVAYQGISRDYLVRWQMTHWLRNYEPLLSPGS